MSEIAPERFLRRKTGNPRFHRGSTTFGLGGLIGFTGKILAKIAHHLELQGLVDF